ncbi:MAG: NADH-quinone oxidoreductase subunit N [Bacteroidota bacterium]
MLEQILQSAGNFKPEIALTVTFCVSIIIELIVRKKVTWVSAVSLVGFAVTGYYVYEQAGTTTSIFSDMYAVDPFATFFKVLILLCSVLIVIQSLWSNELRTGGAGRLGEYYSLVVAMTLGMFLMVGASNLLMMYLSIELTSISSYILAGYMKEAPGSAEASLKYVIYGALSSGLMLYGISIIYGLTGALDIYSINRILADGEVGTIALLIAGMLTIAGFGYKITVAPFHFWSPDVYEGAPITITAFLAVASKAAGFALLIRFFKVTFFDSSVDVLREGFWATFEGFEWNMVLAVLSVLTMTLGNLVAIWQDNMKRLLAYSSIAHAGYILMGIVVLSNAGITAMMIYFVAYLFMNLGAFYAVMLIADKTGSESIEEYKGLGYRSPLIAVSLTVFLLSLTGIPPTFGFIGKFYLFAALIDAQWFWLALIGAANSVLSLYYYVRVIRNMYLRDPVGSGAAIRFKPAHTALLLVFLIPNIAFFLYFTPIVDFARASLVMVGIP